MQVLPLNKVLTVSERLSMPQWLRSLKPPKVSSSPIRQLRIADLFCGAGGMSLGAFEVAYAYGYLPSVAAAIDIDADAIAVYRHNFSVGSDLAISGDMNQLLAGNVGREQRKAELGLIDRIGEVDVLLAGPPCQGHSDLNNHTRRDDDRNWLYLRAVRFAEIFTPSVIIIENVRSVTLDRNGVVKTGSAIFEKLDYHVQDFVINANELGLPQLRKRHVLLATRRAVPKFHLPRMSKAPALSSVIEDLLEETGIADNDIFRTPSRMTKANVERISYLFKKKMFDLPNELRPPCHRDKAHSYLSMYGRLHWDKPAQTITSGFGSPGQGRFIHPKKRRVITPHEAARIQGFPDYFSFETVKSRVKLQELIANAVPPIVAAALLEHVIIHGGLNER